VYARAIRTAGPGDLRHSAASLASSHHTRRGEEEEATTHYRAVRLLSRSFEPLAGVSR
jgi:hypothetical protein